MSLNWSKLTREQARRLIGAASRAEQAAGARFNASGSEADEAAWMEAFTMWEDLRVYAICGEKPEDSE